MGLSMASACMHAFLIDRLRHHALRVLAYGYVFDLQYENELLDLRPTLVRTWSTDCDNLRFGHCTRESAAGCRGIGSSSHHRL